MKKNILIIGSILLVIGVILYIVGISSLGWDFREIYSTREAFTSKTDEISHVHQNIVIDDVNADIVIDKSPNENIQIIYEEREKEKYMLASGNSKPDRFTTDVEIIKEYEYQWYDNIFVIDMYKPQLKVLLPEEFRGEIYINNTNGSVSVSNVKALELEISTTNDSVNLTDVRVTGDNIYLDTTNGTINLENVDSKVIGGYTTNAKINAYNIVAEEITLETTNNKVTAENINSPELIILNTMNADIIFDDIISNQIVLSTTNNDITGNIIGKVEDYIIDSGTTNGNNNLKDINNGVENGKNLSVNTTNGDIEVQFTE